VYDLRENNLHPHQIAAILRHRGTPITTAEVHFIMGWAKYKSRIDRIAARASERRAKIARNRERQLRQERERQRKAEQRLLSLNVTLQKLRTYERFGCKVDKRGKVRLPKMEAAE
jgi:hypothetical protein